MRTNVPIPQPIAQENVDSADPVDTASSRKAIETLRLRAWAFPQVTSRSDNASPYVLVLVRLPGTWQQHTDEMERVAVYPEGIKAVAQVAACSQSQDSSGTTIWAAFHTKTLLGTILENGHATLRITGKLSTGQQFEAVSELYVGE